MNMLECFSAAGLTPEAAARAEAARQETGETLPVVISRMGLLPDDTVVEALSAAFSIAKLSADDMPAERVDLPITEGFLKAHRVLPVKVSGDQLTLAMVDPNSPVALRGVRFATQLNVQPLVIGFHAWRSAFDRLYGGGEAGEPTGTRRAGARWTDDAGGIRELSLDAPAVRLVESLIVDAVDAGASDIHIERKPEGARVRFRVDGQLSERQALSPAMAEAVVARLKVLGDLDVADHRRAQDGRTALSARGRPVDVRLSVIPSVHGEAAVIRLLDRADVRLDYEALGFGEAEISRIREATERPQGLFIVSGPTGGGKTTTLYSVINALRAQNRKIVTIEDPIEYFFDDVHQTQLDDAAGLSFATALRAFLRHDPDVILVGEIRDAETALTAVQAALTGHLVLSTLHAKSAASVPVRLVEMGVEPYLLGSTLTATTAQRLVRRLCQKCSIASSPPQGVTETLCIPGDMPADFRRPVGCASCRGGFKGRMVISETLRVTDTVADKIATGSSLKGQIATSLFEDGVHKAALGLTSLDDVLRAVEQG